MNDKLEVKENEHLSSIEVNYPNLEKRFGKEVFINGITKNEQALPFLKVENQIFSKENTSNNLTHRASLEILTSYTDETPTLSLTDRFNPDKLLDKTDQLNKSLINELATIPNGVEETKSLPPQIADLQHRLKETNSLKAWNLHTVYQPDDMDGCHCYRISLLHKTTSNYPKLCLDLFPGLSCNLNIPLSKDFDKDLLEMKQAVMVMSEWLGMTDTPKLEYSFVKEEVGEVEKEGIPSQTSTSYPEYFHEVLKDWNSIPTLNTLRVLIGESNDKSKPILLIEDPNLEKNINSTSVIAALNGFDNFSRALIIRSHPEIYEIFQKAIDNGVVNPKMVDIFPKEEFSDKKWLHMFIEKNKDGKPILIEDTSSNNGKDELTRLFVPIKEQYGIEYEGKMDLRRSEIEARKPMLMPKINAETAMIKEEYGSTVANRFRGHAISALIYGNLQALEKYQSFGKLL